ncbi:MAG TPA: LysR family transcriptional regulator [Candidatus Dormibacteraeota bacterium]|nr:LysR family transcriptional regulator [Candidatus Dormibacteraeota bacterium]
MLDTWRLQLLREVARRGTVRAAAEAMSVTPSAVSQQLRVLEAEAGVALLERQHGRVRLTAAGDMLARHADAITSAIALAESELATFREEVAGTLRIAAFPTAARALLPAVIGELGRAHPRLRITLRDLESDESILALLADDVELAVVDEYDDATRLVEPALELIPLLDDPLYLATPPGADRPSSGSVLAHGDEHWIMDTESSNIYAALDRYFRRAGFVPNVRSNCRDYGVIIALVEAGLGVAVLPGLAVKHLVTRARLAPLDPSLHRRVLIAVKPERKSHPAVAAMVDALLRATRVGDDPLRPDEAPTSRPGDAPPPTV